MYQYGQWEGDQLGGGRDYGGHEMGVPYRKVSDTGLNSPSGYG